MYGAIAQPAMVLVKALSRADPYPTQTDPIQFDPQNCDPSRIIIFAAGYTSCHPVVKYSFQNLAIVVRASRVATMKLTFSLQISALLNVRTIIQPQSFVAYKQH